MNKEQFSINNHTGFGIIEVIVTSAVLALFITSIFGTLVFTSRVFHVSHAQARATNLAEEGREAVRNIRDEDFTNLIDGTYGLGTIGNQWVFVGTNDTTNEFTRTVDITSIDSSTKAITSRVEWKQYGITRSVESVTQLSNWQKIVPINPERCLEVITSGASFNGNNRILGDIFMQNTCLTSDVTITQVIVSWTQGGVIDRYRFQPTTVWSKTSFGSPSGSQVSGTSLDIVDYTLASTDGLVENIITFDSAMTGQTFGIAYTLSDGSTIEVTDITP